MHDHPLNTVDLTEEDPCANPRRGVAASLADVAARRVARRSVLGGAAKGAALALTVSPVALLAGCGNAAENPSAETRPEEGTGADTSVNTGITQPSFAEIERGVDADQHVAAGYDADVLIRWGDPVVQNAAAFTPTDQTGAAQRTQFGYNNDFIGYVPLPYGSTNSDHGLLCINHEYTSGVMFPSLFETGEDGELYPTALSENMTEADMEAEMKRRAEVEITAHGGTIIEIRKENGQWRTLPSTQYARRITGDTPMHISGPAAGHRWMRTSQDPTGTSVLGTLNNCAGGITPWGTYLTAEENFRFYFGNRLPDGDPRAMSYMRYGLPSGGRWSNVDDRFNTQLEPNEPNRFGWVVEIDPYDATSVPVKRTALGRFAHEGAETTIDKDGRIVVYMGDDARFEYVYKFVSQNAYDPDNRAANANLLDAGTLYVARFNDDGTLDWLPLIYGQNGLDESNGFDSQAQVLIETRRAADILEATPMDRPEDLETSPVTGKVYVMLTNNVERGTPGHDPVNGANPRAVNTAGHIVELTAPDGDHSLETANWDILVNCGDPRREGINATWNPATTENGWFSSPDNCAVDPTGLLWVVTDQGSGWNHNSNMPDLSLPPTAVPEGISADGVWSLETEGEARGTGRMFYRAPVGAEICGPRFTPDGKTLFLAIQHPGDNSAGKWVEHNRPSTFEDPGTRWPDFDDTMPPRPSVVAITKQGGGKIGT